MRFDIFIWHIGYPFLVFTNVLLNMMLVFDTYFLLRNPFYPRKKRCNQYMFTIIFLDVLLFIILFVQYKEWLQGFHLQTDLTRFRDSFVSTIRVAIFCQFACTLLPAILVSIRLLKKGTSKELKWKVFIRHQLFLVVYIASSFNLAFGAFDREMLSVPQKIADYGITIFCCISMSYIRLQEPYVLQTLKQFLRSLCCFQRCKPKESKKPKVKFGDESLCNFLNSAMNIEFVSLILVGIQSSYFDQIVNL